MDFTDETPQFCAIRTSLSTWQIDANWVRNILLLVIGTHLNHTDLNQTRGILSRMEARGFRFITVADTPQSDIISGYGDDDTRWVNKDAASLTRCVPLIMQDPLGKTDLVRFCFFFQ